MENNIDAQKIINKIQLGLIENGIIVSAVVDGLKELRAIFIAEKQPKLTKLTRLIFEHIEANKTFNIAIPVDNEEFDETEEEVEIEEATEKLTQEQLNIESLDYVLSLLKKPTNKFNAEEITAYIKALN